MVWFLSLRVMNVETVVLKLIIDELEDHRFRTYHMNIQFRALCIYNDDSSLYMLCAWNCIFTAATNSQPMPTGSEDKAFKKTTTTFRWGLRIQRLEYHKPQTTSLRKERSAR